MSVSALVWFQGLRCSETLVFLTNQGRTCGTPSEVAVCMQSADILAVAAVCTDLTAGIAVPAVYRAPQGDGAAAAVYRVPQGGGAVAAVYMVLVDPSAGGNFF